MDTVYPEAVSDLSLIPRKHRANLNWQMFYKIPDQNSPKVLMKLMKDREREGLPQGGGD